MSDIRLKALQAENAKLKEERDGLREEVEQLRMEGERLQNALRVAGRMSGEYASVGWPYGWAAKRMKGEEP